MHYQRRASTSPTYPTEWVVRTLAGGDYPRLKLDKTKYSRQTILDLGCGDGRNLRLLQNLGFRVHATEISDHIVRLLRHRRRLMGWNVDFRVGPNTALPYPGDYFDYVLACSSFYYLNRASASRDVLREVSRVLKPGGHFVANVPDLRNSIVKNAKRVGSGTFIIRSDPFNLRNGERWIVMRSRTELRHLLRPHFTDIRIGSLNEDYYGLAISGFIFVCSKPHARR